MRQAGEKRRLAPTGMVEPLHGEELAVGTVLWLAFTHPLAALVVVAILTAAMIWLIPRVWRMIRRIIERVLTWFGYVPHSDVSSRRP